jgi:hypothetical protein
MRKTKFKLLYEDSPGGKYIRKIGQNRYHVLDWKDLPEWTNIEKGEPRYDVELKEIDLDAVGNHNKQKAIEFVGSENGEPLSPERLAEALADYGVYAPMGSWGGNNIEKLKKMARKRSLELDDAEEHY